MINKNVLSILVPLALAAIIFVALEAFFIINENEQGVVTQFGRFVRTIQEPGLHRKTPFIQSVIYYDKRLLDHDVQPTEVVTKDKRTLVIDNFAKWKIINPEYFYTRVKTEAVARDRLRDIIYSELRQDFGAHDLFEIVSTDRAKLMKEVTQRSNVKVKVLNMGIEIADVRIKRADLPPENQLAVFNRMREERKRIAKQFRSEGKEAAQKIRATTDKEKVIILAEAYKKEQTIRGQGDAKSIKITAAAFGKSPEFYSFIRSLEAYKKALLEKDSMIMTEKSSFLKHLQRR
ncbi:MAG TPA: protease modulator HflC [Nitrospinota bacterium]|nr:protease modulator HflC [Nitrospinota bacterium]